MKKKMNEKKKISRLCSFNSTKIFEKTIDRDKKFFLMKTQKITNIMKQKSSKKIIFNHVFKIQFMTLIVDIAIMIVEITKIHEIMKKVRDDKKTKKTKNVMIKNIQQLTNETLMQIDRFNEKTRN